MDKGTDYNGSEKVDLSGAEAPRETTDEVVARLAMLSPIESDKACKEEAKKLGCKASTLFEEVKKARAKQRRQEKPAEVRKEPVPCPKLDDDVITLVNAAFTAAGYGGETKVPMLLYQCASTRLLSFVKGKLLGHAQVVGAPSSGKNFAMDKVLGLLPEDACLRIDAGTPKALIYSDEELAHRIVFFAEADSLPTSEGARGMADGDSRSTAASAMRSLASDGCLNFDVVERGDDGKFVTRHIQKDGPTLLLTTTVKAIGGQMGTRLWEVPIKESDAQIKAALYAGIRDDDVSDSHSVLVDYQAYLQSKAPWHVLVPFAKEIVDCIIHTGMSSRIQRDFQRILALVRAVAVLRHQEREEDYKGRLLATLEDYQAVYDVLHESYAATVNDGLTDDVRAVITAVGELRQGGTPLVRYDTVAKHLGWHRDKVRRNAQTAMERGCLVNNQEKRRQPAILDIGAETPESRGLPTREDIARRILHQESCVRAYANAGAGSGHAEPDPPGAHARERTHDAPNNGTHAEAAPDLTYARTQPFGGICPGGINEEESGSTDEIPGNGAEHPYVMNTPRSDGVYETVVS